MGAYGNTSTDHYRAPTFCVALTNSLYSNFPILNFRQLLQLCLYNLPENVFVHKWIDTQIDLEMDGWIDGQKW